MCITVMNSSLYKIVHNSIVRKNSSPCVMNSSPCVMKFVRRFYTVFSTNDEFITSSHAWWIHHHSSLFNTTVFNSSHTWWIHHTHDDIITGLEDLTQKPRFLCITGPCCKKVFLYSFLQYIHTSLWYVCMSIRDWCQNTTRWSFCRPARTNSAKPEP